MLLATSHERHSIVRRVSAEELTYRVIHVWFTIDRLCRRMCGEAKPRRRNLIDVGAGPRVRPSAYSRAEPARWAQPFLEFQLDGGAEPRLTSGGEADSNALNGEADAKH